MRAFGNGNGLWHLSTACNATLTGHTPVTALFYGLDDSCTYNNNRLVNQGVVTSPSINLEAYATGPIELEVKYFLETEGLPASYDLASIEISENGGLFTAIAHNDSIAAPVTLTDPSGGWVEILVDLSVYAGSSVQLRFGFNTVDRAVNDLAGFYIDDVTIYGPDSGCTPFPANPEPADGEINVPTDSLLQWDNLEAPGDLLQSSTSPDPDLTVGSLTTTFAGGNGQDGNMFDLTAKNAITITGWEGNINASGGPATIEVYYVTDHSSFVGKETNPALWTLLGSVTLATTNPRETPTFVEIGGLAIAASETIGIYWTTTSETNVSYTDGPLGVFENADLRFEDRGTGNAYPFGTVFSPRVWNGTIHYEIGGYDTTYDVYFDTDNPPATLIHSGLTDPSCEPIPYPLDDGTTYYWQVVAHNPGGCQADGRVWSFTTAGGGGCSPPGNPEPANGEADVATDLLLQWGVSEYSGFKFQNGGFLSKDQSSLDWKAKPPISEPEKALNANAPANASQDMLLFHQTPHAVSYVAIFQEEDPWGYAINQQVLTQNGIAYVIYDAASMGLVDLSAYDKVIISSVQDPGFYLSLEANKLWFENYVEAGGLLDIHIATYGEQPVLPGGFEITVLPAEDISIVDTDHPIVTLPNAITEAELNGWNYSVHGYISTVPAGAQEILEITSTGLPCAMELNVGLGSIFVTTQTVEWDGAS
ncbi:MAG: hypothetical protein ACYTE1_07830, partial [Planctomycetota bacterium]